MLKAAFAVMIVVALVRDVAADGEFAADFKCQICQAFYRAKMADPTIPFETACTAAAIDNGMEVSPTCALLRRSLLKASGSATIRHGDVRDRCRADGMCPVNEAFEAAYATALLRGAETVDLRIAPGYALKGSEPAVRVTIVDNEAAAHSKAFLDFFDYNAPFKWAWQNKTLHSKYLKLDQGHPAPDNRTWVTQFSVGGEYNITTRIPMKGQPVTLMLFADPCFSGEWVGCKDGGHWKIYERLTKLMNDAAAQGDVDGWVLIGDNFYDPHGILAPKFFAGLTLEAKSKLFITINGNHDLWQHGSPKSKKGGYDQFGVGFGQYWGQDTAATVNSTIPYDFSVNPFVGRDKESDKLPAVSNFFQLHHVGNTVFLLFNGANERDAVDPYFRDACAYLGREKPAVMFVVTHWTHINLGCKKGMDAPAAWKHIKTLPGCKEMADRIKYLEGHTHCNAVVAPDHGFRVAGFGMGGGCHFKHDNGSVLLHNFGIPFLTTHEKTATIGYLPVEGSDGFLPKSAADDFTVPHNDGDDEHNNEASVAAAADDKFDAITTCVRAHGFKNCLHLGVTWLHMKL